MYEQIEQLWTEDAMGYDNLVKRQLANVKDVRHWQTELKAVLGDKSSLNVLDVGCGPGFFTIMLSRLGHHVISIDGAEGMVKCAGRNFAAEGIDVNLYCGDAVALNKEKQNSLDAIVSRDVVWTLYDPRKAYERWMEVLKPGGLVVVYDGNYRRDVHSYKTSIWKAMSNIVIFFTEWRIPKKAEHHDKDIFTELPSVTVERPAMDRDILEQLGYEIVTIEDDSYRNSFKKMEYWKYGYQGKKFKIVARKPKL
ncbi:class I SAM-dependent methyltransferase [Desulfosporosinus sp. BICA1-9]|uniref:class I SAM-dependent methyltransferase n=1 Tax=Desulfosporosinus sp. BICA1-9 TaxID=1531958 RepID=UPI00054BB72F|nr:class I SAM-dependent methyltransferase [Desulfosporosinus sp. BICA1-9]